MKHVFPILTFLFLSITGSSQTGYILTDSSQVAGLKVVMQSPVKSSATCIVDHRGFSRIYTPSELRGYSTDRKAVYVSRWISVNGESRHVFLRRMGKSTPPVYSYKGPEGPVFFAETDSSGTFTSVSTRKDFVRFAASRYPECPKVLRFAGNAGMNRESASRFLEMADQCKIRSIPDFKCGITGGFQWMTISIGPGAPESITKNAFFTSFIIPVYGLWVDVPISPIGFSFHGEVLYHQFDQTTSSFDGMSWYTVNLKIRNLSLPLLFRYNTIWYPSLYIEAGPVAGFNITNEGFISDGFGEQRMVNAFQPGFALGTGLNIRVSGHFGLMAGVRYGMAFSTTQEYYDMYDLGMVLGLFF